MKRKDNNLKRHWPANRESSTCAWATEANLQEKDFKKAYDATKEGINQARQWMSDKIAP